MNMYPWQQTQWQHLGFHFRKGQFPHALLLSGPQDMGKLKFAQILAKRLLCSVQDAEFACDHCRSCRWVEEGIHPDLFLIQPETPGSAIKIETIRQLVEDLSQTGQQGGYQVVIIDPAEAMNKAAANALLKTLEEPNGRVIFLLVSHQPGLLPATIISRCQKLVFPPPAIQLSLSWLAQQLPQKTPAELQNLLNLNEYIPLRSLKFYSDEQQAVYEKIIQGFLQLYSGQISPLQMASLCMDYDFILVFNVLWLVIADLLQLKLQAEPRYARLQTQVDLLQQLSHSTSCLQLLRFTDQLLLAKQQVVANKINLNAQLLFEALFALH